MLKIFKFFDADPGFGIRDLVSPCIRDKHTGSFILGFRVTHVLKQELGTVRYWVRHFLSQKCRILPNFGNFSLAVYTESARPNLYTDTKFNIASSAVPQIPQCRYDAGIEPRTLVIFCNSSQELDFLNGLCHTMPGILWTYKGFLPILYCVSHFLSSEARRQSFAMAVKSSNRSARFQNGLG